MTTIVNPTMTSAAHGPRQRTGAALDRAASA